MKRDRLIAFRASATDEERVAEIARLTGGTVSGVLRQLIASAELQPTSTLRPIANLKSDTSLIFPDPAGIAS